MIAQRLADLDRGPRRTAISVAVVVAAIAIGAVVIAILRSLGVADAAPAFLLAVVVVAVLRGTGPAVVTAIGAFFAYDFFFIEPLYTLTVRDPQEWLNLLLLLVVGIVVGRLAGASRARAEAAIEGEQSARAMFDVSFTMSTRKDTPSALRPIADIVRDETTAERVWIVVGDSVQADTAWQVGPPDTPPVYEVLRRQPGDAPAEWVRLHAAQARTGRGSTGSDHAVYRVNIAAAGQTFGALWVKRRRSLGEPDVSDTQVMAAAADQIGAALERDRLLRDATAAEISRRSDALKSALLDSVSHDLRTPLASIRAAAGTLMDPDIDWPADQRRAIAASIDREAEWLNRLVTNLLDMSRVEAGELKPTLVVLTVDDIIDEALRRTDATFAGRRLEVDIAPNLPPVVVDELFIGQVLANLLDNAAKYAGPAAVVRIAAAETDEHRIRITVEDGGSGVPAESLPRLFEKFYRVPRKGEGSRRGTGIGLAVVLGLVEAMGGRVIARASDLGGLAVDVDLPEASAVDDETAGEDQVSIQAVRTAERPVA